jgi:hypothetical protein
MCGQDAFDTLVNGPPEEGVQKGSVTISTGKGAHAPGLGRVHFGTVPELLDFGVALGKCFYPEQKSGYCAR